MVRENYYALLGLDSSASQDEVRKAYRRLVFLYHPDKNPENPGAEEHFKKIAEAYEVLFDPVKRAAYDRSTIPLEEQALEWFRQPEEFFFRKNFSENPLQQIFEDFFDPGRSRQKKSRGANLRYHLQISMAEATYGTEVDLKIPQISVCPVCQGQRCSPGTRPKICPTCQGNGSLRAQRGFFSVDEVCQRCQGQGQIIVQPCRKCKGTGRLEAIRHMRVNIPAGVAHGTYLRIRGEGRLGKNGTSPGDIFLIISVK